VNCSSGEGGATSSSGGALLALSSSSSVVLVIVSGNKVGARVAFHAKQSDEIVET
jgi:hypothetical protein